MSLLYACLMFALLTMFPALVWGLYVLAFLCLGVVVICALSHGAEQLGQEWRAMWRPLQRLCPAWLRPHLWGVGICLALIVPTLAHTLGVFLTAALR